MAFADREGETRDLDCAGKREGCQAEFGDCAGGIGAGKRGKIGRKSGILGKKGENQGCLFTCPLIGKFFKLLFLIDLCVIFSFQKGDFWWQGGTPYHLLTVLSSRDPAAGQGCRLPPASSEPALWVVEGSGGEHGGENFEPSVRHSTQGSAMRLPTGTHGGVSLFALRIAHHTNPRPMVKSIS